jgi:hypothetical protein
MVEVYNFLAAWQLFPEKGTYEFGNRPKSGIYKIELSGTGKEIAVSMNWVSLEDQAFSSNYAVLMDGGEHAFENKEEALEFAKLRASGLENAYEETQKIIDQFGIYETHEEVDAKDSN